MYHVIALEASMNIMRAHNEHVQVENASQHATRKLFNFLENSRKTKWNDFKPHNRCRVDDKFYLQCIRNGSNFCWCIFVRTTTNDTLLRATRVFDLKHVCVDSDKMFNGDATQSRFQWLRIKFTHANLVDVCIVKCLKSCWLECILRCTDIAHYRHVSSTDFQSKRQNEMQNLVLQ